MAKMDTLFYNTGMILFWSAIGSKKDGVRIYPDMPASEWAKLPADIKQKMKGKRPI